MVFIHDFETSLQSDSWMVIKEFSEHQGVDVHNHTFALWNRMMGLVHMQLTHAIGLNDVCDALQMNLQALATIFEGDTAEPKHVKSCK